MRKKIKTIAILYAVILIPFILYVYFFRLPLRPVPPSAELAPVQENAGWRKNESFQSQNSNSPAEEMLKKPNDGIFVRSEEVDDGDLLVKFSAPQQFYKYEGQTDKIAAISESEWLQGKSEISCRQRRFSDSSGFIARGSAYELYYWGGGGGKIPTHGQYAMDFSEAPDKKLAIILSADGPKTGGSFSVIFGSSAPQPAGWRYVQIINRESKNYVTQPLALTSHNQFPHYWFCWTDDEKFVLAYEVEEAGISEFELNFHVIKTNR